jgi:hypothetical protein
MWPTVFPSTITSAWLTLCTTVFIMEDFVVNLYNSQPRPETCKPANLKPANLQTCKPKTDTP